MFSGGVIFQAKAGKKLPKLKNFDFDNNNFYVNLNKCDAITNSFEQDFRENHQFLRKFYITISRGDRG